MKKFRYILFSIVLVAGAFTACDTVDFGDTNVDDDSVTEANTEGLMAGAMNRYFTLGGGNYLAVPTLYTQYQSQAVYTTEQRYGASAASWNGYYVQTLSNLKEVRDITTSEEVDDITRSYGAPVNQANVADLMSVLIWKRVTDNWGAVPYTNALGEGESITPEYTDQETIYKDLISRAKTARDNLDESLAGPTGDPLYGGDVTMWKKFANSFIMNLSMQLSKKYPGSGGYAATEFSAALNHGAGVIDEISEEMWYNHANQSGMENPFSGLRGADYNLSDAFDRALRGVSDGTHINYSNDQYDDRLNVFSSDTSLDGRPYGYAELEDPPSYASMSSAVLSPDSPLPYFTAAKTYLLRAEAANRGWTGEVAADMLTNGIEMSYATIDTHYDDGDASTGNLQSDGTAYATARLAEATTSASMEQVIGEELWVAQFPMGFQSWSHWRRTGYPDLIPAPDAVNNGEIPRRYIYPSEESGVNGENYNNAVDLLSPSEDGINSRFWWDTQ